jgi:hypothetical protein
MAAAYQIVTQYETDEFLGGTQTRPVIAIGVVTAAHGIYFEARIGKKEYEPVFALDVAQAGADEYEGLFDIPGVVGVQWSQVPTVTEQLQDTLTVFYTSTSGNSSNSFAFPAAQIAHDTVAAEVAAGVQVLDQVEAG